MKKRSMQRFFAVVLSFVLAFTMIPVLAGQGTADAAASLVLYKGSDYSDCDSLYVYYTVKDTTGAVQDPTELVWGMTLKIKKNGQQVSLYPKLYIYDRDNGTLLCYCDLSDTKYTDGSVVTYTLGVRRSDGSGYYSTSGSFTYKHSWTGKVTKAAGYTHTGTKTYTCSLCHQTKTQVIPKKNAKAVTPAKPKLKSAKGGKRKVTLKWTKVAKNTKGYQIALRDSSIGKTTYINVGQGKKKTVKKVIKKLTKKHTYLVKVRAYNKIGSETIYGPWSNGKAGKAK